MSTQIRLQTTLVTLEKIANLNAFFPCFFSMGSNVVPYVVVPYPTPLEQVDDANLKQWWCPTGIREYCYLILDLILPWINDLGQRTLDYLQALVEQG